MMNVLLQSGKGLVAIGRP